MKKKKKGKIKVKCRLKRIKKYEINKKALLWTTTLQFLKHFHTHNTLFLPRNTTRSCYDSLCFSKEFQGP